MTITASEFATKLNENIMKIEFEKLDGAMRTMICTRRNDLVPEEHQPKNGWNVVGDEATEVARGFSIKLCGWYF
jgi:hypothetical protein